MQTERHRHRAEIDKEHTETEGQKDREAEAEAEAAKARGSYPQCYTTFSGCNFRKFIIIIFIFIHWAQSHKTFSSESNKCS